MSIILALLLLVLFLSMHSCNARVLGVAHYDPAAKDQLFHQYSITKENDDAKVMSGGERHVLSENSAGEGNTTDAEKGKSNVNVAKKTTYKVPNKEKGGRRRDPEAGFDLDYLPPRTHPPSHN